MKNYKSIKQGFGACAFSVMLPKITIVEPFVNIEFSISFMGKPHPTKFIVKECSVTDKLGNAATLQLEGQNNFLGNIKPKLTSGWAKT